MGFLSRIFGGRPEPALPRQAESEVVQSRSDPGDILDSIQTFTAKLGLDGRILLVGRAAQAASGFTQEQLLGMKMLDGPWFTFDPEVHAAAQKAFAKAASGEP